MLNLILKSNDWYENLSELKHLLFFVVVILGGIITSFIWRISYVFLNWYNDYKNGNL